VTRYARFLTALLLTLAVEWRPALPEDLISRPFASVTTAELLALPVAGVSKEAVLGLIGDYCAVEPGAWTGAPADLLAAVRALPEAKAQRGS